jgi:putative transposase
LSLITPPLSIGQQCKLLSISRSSFYYTPNGETEQNLGPMRRIDEQFLEPPFFGVRMTSCNRERPQSALGGKPPAVVCRQRKDETQPDQQVQGAA